MKNDKPFHQNLDELIHLFKKVKENQKKYEFKDIDITFLADFEILLNNYDLVKESVPPEMLDNLGAPIKELIEELVLQLKKELENAVELAKIDANVDETELHNDLNHVVELLKQDDLTVAEIDFLLDRRTELLEQQKRIHS